MGFIKFWKKEVMLPHPVYISWLNSLMAIYIITFWKEQTGDKTILNNSNDDDKFHKIRGFSDYFNYYLVRKGSAPANDLMCCMRVISEARLCFCDWLE
jgi:hypothetical protein